MRVGCSSSRIFGLVWCPGAYRTTSFSFYFFRLLGQSDIGVPWALRIRIMHQIARGMNCLHLLKQQLLHMDLKPANVLLTKDFEVRVSHTCVSV